MGEETIRVLRMLEEGKIDAEEAARLLESLASPGDSQQGGRAAPAGGRGDSGRAGQEGPRHKFLKIKVFEDGENKVTVNLPLQLARLAFKLVPKDYLGVVNELDLEEIVAAIQEGAEGKIVEVADGDDRVEVLVE